MTSQDISPAPSTQATIAGGGTVLHSGRVRRPLAAIPERLILPILITSLTVPSANAAAPQKPPAGQPATSIAVEYREPKNPAHQELYRKVRDRRTLEQLAEVLAAIRLPKPLTLIFLGCDGMSNAFYTDKYRVIMFCYEFLDDIHRAATANQKTDIVSVEDATDGPVAFVLLHESGHAVFDLLKVPIFGKEEDAADHFAAMMLLRMGKGVTIRWVKGAAWAYAHAAKEAKLDASDYSDIHSLDSQRYYNIACLLYGHDRELYAPLVKEGYLPEARAERCEKEYQQALYAMEKLIRPYIDEERAKRIRVKYAK